MGAMQGQTTSIYDDRDSGSSDDLALCVATVCEMT
jgi:hypothetical protein